MTSVAMAIGKTDCDPVDRVGTSHVLEAVTESLNVLDLDIESLNHTLSGVRV